MSSFQHELMTADLSFNQTIQADLRHYFTATQTTCMCLDMFTNGLLPFYLSKTLPKTAYLGSFSCSDITQSQAFTQLKPGTLASAGHSLSCAKQIASLYRCHVSICISGILSNPDQAGFCTSKIYLAFSFYGHESEKIIECVGTQDDIYQQAIQASLGYLKLLFIKYPKKQKEY
mgnify:CR=1 FL=1